MLWDAPPSVQRSNPQQLVDEATSTEAAAASYDLVDGSFMSETESNFGCSLAKFDPQAVIDKLKFSLGEAATAAGGDDVFTNLVQPQQPAAEYSVNSGSFVSVNSASEGYRPTADEDSGQALWPQYSLTFEQNSQTTVHQSSDTPQASAGEFEASSTELSNKENESITTNGVASNDGVEADGVPSAMEQEPKKKPSAPEAGPKLENGDLDPDLEPDQLDASSGAGDDTTFDPSLIPTISEVAQLLPSVIEAMGSGSDPPLPILPPQPASVPQVLIQEPKRLDRDECRLNLLDHIASVQAELELRLDSIEASLSNIVDDADRALASVKSRSMLTAVLRDLGTARTLMWSLK
jgi:hypothetical protein